jgi:hypothetical protein
MADGTSTALSQAQQALDAGRSLMDRAWAQLRSRCQRDDGKLSGKLLDEHQLASYDGAVCDAALTGAQFMLRYAEKALESDGGDVCLEERFALIAAAEALAETRQRVGTRVSDYGLTSEIVADTIDHPEVRAFCEAQLTTKNLAEVGQLVRDREGYVGVSMLGEDHEMMRDTFRQFANDVVAPKAEEVHRHDAMIPDEILDQVKELGCFGISIAERYGGLQPDDREDTLSMCVVTEELSKASLGIGRIADHPPRDPRPGADVKGGTEEQKQPLAARSSPTGGSGHAGRGRHRARLRLRRRRHQGHRHAGTRAERRGRLAAQRHQDLAAPSAARAGALTLLARTDPGHRAKTHKRPLAAASCRETRLARATASSYTQQADRPRRCASAPARWSGRADRRRSATAACTPTRSLPRGLLRPRRRTSSACEGGLGKGFYYHHGRVFRERPDPDRRARRRRDAGRLRERRSTYAEDRKVFGQPVGRLPAHAAPRLARMAVLTRSA